MSLSLEVDEATVDAANKTLSWPVTSQPWDDGDKLMLRIAEVVLGIALIDVPSTITQGQSHTFAVRASGLSSTESKSIRLSTANGALGFGSCSTVATTVGVPPRRTSYILEEALHGCIATSDTVTATLLQGSTTLGTATAEVEVEASSQVTVTLRPRQGQYSTDTDMTVEWTDPNECVGSYFVGIFNSEETVVRNLGFHPAPAATSLSADPSLS